MAGRLTAKRCGELFQNPKRNGSSHYGIGYDGTIAQYVDEKYGAWTNSNKAANCRAVTIETANDSTGGNWPVNDITLNSLIRLVADIAKRNNLIPLVKGKNLTWH
jgi:N-acetyl-anhydromuramyl-L-alanine amidase AmpD